MTQPTGPMLPAPLDCAVFTPIGAVAKIIGPDDDASCTERGRHEVDEVLGRIERAVLTAHGTGRIAVAFGVPMLQQRIAQRIVFVRFHRIEPGKNLRLYFFKTGERCRRWTRSQGNGVTYFGGLEFFNTCDDKTYLSGR